MNHYTYMIKANDMFYIGVRSCDGLPEEDNYFSSCKTLLSWIKRNGVDKVVKSIIAVFPTRNLAVEHEIELHHFYDVAKNKLFWNKAKQTSNKFDTAGTKLSKEHIEKVMKHVRGIPQSEEHKRKRAEAITGKVVSEEQKAKQSAKMKGRKLTAEHVNKIVTSKIGRKHSEETKAKIAASSKGKKMSEESIKKMRTAAIAREQKKREATL